MIFCANQNSNQSSSGTGVGDTEADRDGLGEGDRWADTASISLYSESIGNTQNKWAVGSLGSYSIGCGPLSRRPKFGADGVETLFDRHEYAHHLNRL